MVLVSNKHRRWPEKRPVCPKKRFRPTVEDLALQLVKVNIEIKAVKK
jgi:hypothetical protein